MKVSKSPIIGKGLFADEQIKKNEKISYIDGPIRVVRDFSNFNKKDYLASYNWIGVGRYSWIDTATSPFRYINHSCEPNVAIIGKKTVIALEDISKGEELTMDYSLTEAGQDWSISCSCGTKSCRKKIGPINTLPKSVYNKHSAHITKNFKSLYRTLTKKYKTI